MNRYQYKILFQNLGANVTEDVGEIEALRRQLRERFVDIVATAPVESVDALDQTNFVMTSMLSRPSELTLRSQVTMACKTACYSACIWYLYSHTDNSVS